MHDSPFRVGIGWLLEEEKAQAESASICVEAGFLGGVKVGEYRCSSEQFFSLLEGYVVDWCPEKVIPCAQKRPQWHYSAGASSFVQVVNWFVRPIKERRSVRLLGVGKLVIASTMSLLMEYPSEVSTRPASGPGGGNI